jgi:hypothetical protein
LIGFFEVEATPDKAVDKAQGVAPGKAAVDRAAVDAATGTNPVLGRAATACARIVGIKNRM